MLWNCLAAVSTALALAAMTLLWLFGEFLATLALEAVWRLLRLLARSLYRGMISLNHAVFFSQTIE